MELLELLKKRRSHRKFDGRAVNSDVVDRIMEGVMTAPSSKNSHSSRFLVVTQKEALEKMSLIRSYGSALLKDAPMAIVIMGDSSLTDLWGENCAISATIMQLCAESEGLGSCWVHVHNRPHHDDNPTGISAEDYLRTVIEIPDNYRILCIVAMGYAIDQIPDRKPRDYSNMVTYLG